jgi:hypothetical protein
MELARSDLRNSAGVVLHDSPAAALELAAHFPAARSEDSVPDVRALVPYDQE